MTGSGGPVAASEQPVRTVGAAVDAFLARPDLAVSSRRSYAQTLTRVAADVGVARALATLEADALDSAVQDAAAVLRATCAQRYEGDFSSFVVTPRAGLPLEPGMYVPSLSVPLDTPRR
jgi:hypothetical protein